MDPIEVNDDMYELGLVSLCPGWIGRDSKRRRCGLETVSPGAFCTGHGGDQLAVQRVVVRQRKILEEELLPVATRRVMNILMDPEAKDTDVIRVWSTIMDRVGLAATTNLEMSGEVSGAAPLDILRAMLMVQSEVKEIEGSAVEDGVVEGELVEE